MLARALSNPWKVTCVSIAAVTFVVAILSYWNYARTSPLGLPIAEFQVGRDGRPLLIEGTVNGKTVIFHLDTGATRSIFDAQMRPDLGKSLGQSVVNLPDGEAAFEEFACPMIALGELRTKSDQPIFCRDLQNRRAAAGEEFTAVLGMDVLKQYVLQIDFDEGAVRIYPPISRSSETLGVRLPLSHEANAPWVLAQCGSTDLKFLIDTGSTGSCLERIAMEGLAAKGELV